MGNSACNHACTHTSPIYKRALHICKRALHICKRALKSPMYPHTKQDKRICIYRNTLQHTATHCNTLQHTATHCNTLQHTAQSTRQEDMYIPQHTATHCNTLQHIATHCNTPHNQQDKTRGYVYRPAHILRRNTKQPCMFANEPYISAKELLKARALGCLYISLYLFCDT